MGVRGRTPGRPVVGEWPCPMTFSSDLLQPELW